jgi:hypothetical protein
MGILFHELLYLPFALLGFAIFMVVPRLRRYALYAALLPLVFAFTSLIGLLIFLGSVGYLNHGMRTPEWMRWMIIPAYVLPGLLGSYGAARMIQIAHRRLGE